MLTLLQAERHRECACPRQSLQPQCQLPMVTDSQWINIHWRFLRLFWWWAWWAEHDGLSLSAWTFSILPDGAHQAVRSCTQPSWTQVGWVEDRGSTAHTFITWRSSVRRRSDMCMENGKLFHVCRSPFVQSTLLTVSAKISRHIFLMSLLIRDILLTLFLHTIQTVTTCYRQHRESNLRPHDRKSNVLSLHY